MTTNESVPLSILDLAIIGSGQTAADAFANSVALAQHGEANGYQRVWYAEHHNMSVVASSSPSVLIAHVANQTSTIRLGAGGVMLPNHSPLTIAEQYGTLEALHPGRIDLGLGRAPGSDQAAAQAMRRDLGASNQFPEDVLELQAFLGGNSRVPGVEAVPCAETTVPLWILGSSLFGAQLAAALGLPYAFASHFAPGALLQAIEVYRSEFRPSAQLAEPYAMAAVNVIAADTQDDADLQFVEVRRKRVGRFLARGGQELTDDQIDQVINTPQGQQIVQMMHYSAVGTAESTARYVQDFADAAHLDEVITAHAPLAITERLRSVELLAVGMKSLEARVLAS